MEEGREGEINPIVSRRRNESLNLEENREREDKE